MFETLRLRIAKWRDFRLTVGRLRALDDHILADIGYDRREIRTCVKAQLEEARCQ